MIPRTAFVESEFITPNHPQRQNTVAMIKTSGVKRPPAIKTKNVTGLILLAGALRRNLFQLAKSAETSLRAPPANGVAE